MRNRILANNYLVALGNAKCETLLDGLTSLPASGSFINVSGYELVHVIVHLGTLDPGGSPVFTLKCSDSASGTLDVVNASASVAYTANVTTEDGYVALWTLEVANLPEDHHFIAMALSGTVTSCYADIIFLLEPRHLPVTQTSTVVPSTSQFSYVG